MSVAGKRVLVTGASQGIGHAIATEFAAAGARVVMAARREKLLAKLAAEVPGGAESLPLDLSDRASIDSLVAMLGDDIDILVHCGGMYASGTMAEAKAGGFDDVMTTNVLGPYELTRQLLPAIVARRGQIAFINSSIVRGGGAATGQFAASAHALRALADSLRAEVNPAGVRVLSVFPGRTATPRQEGIFATENRQYVAEDLLQAEDVARTVLYSLLLPPSAELTDVWLRPARNFAPARK